MSIEASGSGPAHGRAYFAREEALAVLGLKPEALSVAVTRLVKKRRLANPRYGHFLILFAWKVRLPARPPPVPGSGADGFRAVSRWAVSTICRATLVTPRWLAPATHDARLIQAAFA